MNQEKRFSDEFLNAFVDNQLADEDKGHAYIEISQDESLNRQVCELRKMRDLVQLAYRDIPPPPVRATKSSSLRVGIGFGIAAAVVLAVGVVLGIQLKLPDSLREQSAKIDTPTVQPAKAVIQHARSVKPASVPAPARPSASPRRR